VIQLALALNMRPVDVAALDDVELATVVDLLEERQRG
jgi:hypothetical protein